MLNELMNGQSIETRYALAVALWIASEAHKDTIDAAREKFGTMGIESFDRLMGEYLKQK